MELEGNVVTAEVSKDERVGGISVDFIQVLCNSGEENFL